MIEIKKISYNTFSITLDSTNYNALLLISKEFAITSNVAFIAIINKGIDEYIKNIQEARIHDEIEKKKEETKNVNGG